MTLTTNEENQATMGKRIDQFLFMGQSNMAGRGVASLAPVVPAGHGYEFRAVTDPTRLYDIIEPFGQNENVPGAINDVNNRKSGSLVSAFVNEYYSETKVPVVGVSASEGGTRIKEWQPDSARNNDAVRRYQASVDYLNGQDFTIRHRYMVWCQGETDGDEGVTKEQYMSDFKTFTEYWYRLGIEKIFIIRIGDLRDDLTKYNIIIDAQTELGRTYDKCVLVSTKFSGMAENGLMKDAYHFKQEGYNITGADAGRNTAYYVDNAKEPSMFDSKYNKEYVSVK